MEEEPGSTLVTISWLFNLFCIPIGAHCSVFHLEPTDQCTPVCDRSEDTAIQYEEQVSGSTARHIVER